MCRPRQAAYAVVAVTLYLMIRRETRRSIGEHQTGNNERNDLPGEEFVVKRLELFPGELDGQVGVVKEALHLMEGREGASDERKSSRDSKGSRGGVFVGTRI